MNGAPTRPHAMGGRSVESLGAQSRCVRRYSDSRAWGPSLPIKGPESGRYRYHHSFFLAPPLPMDSRFAHASSETIVIHGDHGVQQTTDVAPALHVSTTFRYAEDPDKLAPASDGDVSGFLAGTDRRSLLRPIAAAWKLDLLSSRGSKLLAIGSSLVDLTSSGCSDLLFGTGRIPCAARSLPAQRDRHVRRIPWLPWCC
jgi:hypothetical protein